jgi:hypothetical protein
VVTIASGDGGCARSSGPSECDDPLAVDRAKASKRGKLAQFADDSPLEGGGFELPVPDERGYGLAFVCRVMGLLFGARLLGFEGAKRPDSLAGRPGSWSN